MRLPLIISTWTTLDATNVLELGCGQARLSSRLIRISSKYIAVEPDQESFLFAKQLLGENNVSLGTSAEFNQRNSFTLIFSTEVLEHIENVREEIKHWNSILRLGGNVLITVPAHERLFGPANQVVGHYRRYSKSRIISIFEENGFQVKDIILFGGVSSLILLLIQNLVALFERKKSHLPN